MERIYFRLCSFAVVYVAVAIFALHLIQPEISVFAKPISEYVLGRWGSLITSALLIWGIAGILFGIRIRNLRVSDSPSVAFIVFGVGLIGASVIPLQQPFPPERPLTGDLTHVAAATLATISFPVALTLLYRSREQIESVETFQDSLVGLGYFSIVTTLAFFLVAPIWNEMFGALQRSVVVADLLWLGIASWKLGSTETPD